MQATQFYKDGDKSKAICEDCSKLVTTTFGYRDVPFSDGVGMAQNILVACCDECERVVAIPAQSTPQIRAAREKATEPIEAVLPKPYFDLLDLACVKIDREHSAELRKPLFIYYVSHFASGAFSMSRLKSSGLLVSQNVEFQKGPTRRLSMKTYKRYAAELDSVVCQAEMNRTETIKAIIGVIQEDIVEEQRPELIKNLRDFFPFTAA